MSIIAEKGGGSFQGFKLLPCENPLPPIDEAIAAAQAEAAHSNYYTEPCSAPLRQLISEQLGVVERLIHINAGQLRSRDILIKPLNDPALGPGFMRITTALPEDNRRFVDARRALLI